MGYQQHAGGGWSGDVLIADWEELDNASHVSEVYIRRINSQEMFPVKEEGKFIFPLALGLLNQPGDLKPKDEERSRRKKDQRRKKAVIEVLKTTW